MPTKQRSPNNPEDLNRFVTFSGTIARGELVVPIRFQVRFGKDGDLRFRVYPLPMTNASYSLIRGADADNGGKFARHTISATSATGTRFESDSIIFTGTGTRSTDTVAHVTLKLGYSMATFIRDQDNGDTPPTIRWSLRGFEAYPGMEGSCDLGAVHMRGNYPNKGGDNVSGVATVQAQEQVIDTSVWLNDAEKLFLHLRDIMSFAMARQIDYPARDTWVDGQWRRVAYSQSKSRRGNQPVHHPMRMQEVFKAALAAYFEPPVAARNLSYVIEWLTMHATFTEMRLTNAMTALENLADSNLVDKDKLFMLPKEFEAFSKRVRNFADADLRELVEGSDDDRALAALEMRAAMKAKLQDLNRRPLFDRVMILAKRWSVPLDGLDPKEVRAAIVARNNIVHRGYYYEPDRGTREQADLWDHVHTVRELAIRFVLTIIGFKGHYLSFRGGQNHVTFPPPSTGSRAATMGEVAGAN